MSVQTAIAIAVVAGFGAAQYILMVQTLRDLIRRPRVRGGNKAAWALVILCLPVAGALLYSWMGPTSLLRRPDAADRPVTRRSMHYAGRTPSRRNITPIGEARNRKSREATPQKKASKSKRRFLGSGS